MANTFFIGDTHFGHKGIITFDAVKSYRPFATIEERDEEIVKRWNSVVRKGDLVWHLGGLLLWQSSFTHCRTSKWP